MQGEGLRVKGRGLPAYRACLHTLPRLGGNENEWILAPGELAGYTFSPDTIGYVIIAFHTLHVHMPNYRLLKLTMLLPFFIPY